MGLDELAEDLADGFTPKFEPYHPTFRALLATIVAVSLAGIVLYEIHAPPEQIRGVGLVTGCAKLDFKVRVSLDRTPDPVFRPTDGSPREIFVEKDLSEADVQQLCSDRPTIWFAANKTYGLGCRNGCYQAVGIREHKSGVELLDQRRYEAELKKKAWLGTAITLVALSVVLVVAWKVRWPRDR